MTQLDEYRLEAPPGDLLSLSPLEAVRSPETSSIGGPGRLGRLTGMRFFAALAVVLCHVGYQFTNTSSVNVAESYGYVGVSFFFVLSGLVLTILPAAIAGMMLLVNPSYMVVLWQHPMGKNLIAAAGVCLLLAHFVISKIVDIEV